MRPADCRVAWRAGHAGAVRDSGRAPGASSPLPAGRRRGDQARRERAAGRRHLSASQASLAIVSASGGAQVRLEADGVAEVVLNRPGALNALNTAILLQLAGYFAEIGADQAVRVVVLSAAGERA